MGVISTLLSVIALAEMAVAGALFAPTSPVFLPDTSCRVTEERYHALAINMSYADVVRVLGCEGVLVSQLSDKGEVLLSEYAWRTEPWPFGAVRAEFYKNTLQGQSWIAFALKVTPSD